MKDGEKERRERETEEKKLKDKRKKRTKEQMDNRRSQEAADMVSIIHNQ